MTQLTLIKHQSWTKIGTIAGLFGGYLLSGGNRFAGDLLGVFGTTVGAFISMPTQKNIIENSANSTQLDILKNHFSYDGNPLQTNYNLYERDPIGSCLSWFESFKNKVLSKFTTVEEKTCYRNKMISEKYIVFDTFYNKNPQSIILDTAPLVMILSLHPYKSITGKTSEVESTKNWGIILSDIVIKSLIDITIIYGSKPIINYILYTQDNLNDYERVELEFNKNEIGFFEDVLPPELAVEVNRVSA